MKILSSISGSARYRDFGILFLGLLFVSSAMASDVINISQSPLYTTTAAQVKPNLMFILDNSGSMGDDALPDQAKGFTDTGYYGGRSSQCNGVAYNPNIKYTVPVDYSGADYATPSYTAACSNGFTSSTCNVNLSTDATANYYYKYGGKEAALDYRYKVLAAGGTSVDTSTVFYKECLSQVGNAPGSSVFTKVAVSSTSGVDGSDERTNYAIWYSFYRTRMLMMKTAVTQAFKSVDNSFRVGFSTISYTGTDSNNAGFLAINDFTGGSGGQKALFYSKLTKASGSSYTPLRGALSKAGRIFAGKLGGDPMQYSCQQNFALLSTDGYWNTDDETTSYGPYGLDNSTVVGQQDGSAATPMWDGTLSVKTDTTPTVTTVIVTTPQTVTDRSTRTQTSTRTTIKTRNLDYVRTKITTAKNSCTGSNRNVTTTVYRGTRVETQKTIESIVQTQELLSTTTQDLVATTTSTVTHTVVTTNGKVTTDTVSDPPDVSTSSAVQNASTTTGTWTNVGDPVVTVTSQTSTYSPTSATVSAISWTQVSTTTTGCISPPSTSDAITAGPTYGDWSTPPSVPTTSPTNSSATHDATYPRTVNGSSVTTQTGPTVGATQTSTAGSFTGPQNTLADVAMYYYETDLRYPGNCTSGSATKADLCPKDSSGKYSPNVPGAGDDINPKPHMTTFTLGLGMNGLLDYSPTYQSDTIGDYPLIKKGEKIWSSVDTTKASGGAERVDDLWHAAVNGRGQYFSAKEPAALVKSLSAALAGMSTRLGYGTAAATSNLAPIEGDNALYVASFTTAQWTGNLVAESINPTTGEIIEQPAWCLESLAADDAKKTTACTGTLASKIWASSDTRNIYFNKAGSLTSFLYSNLDGTQGAWFDPSKLSQWSRTFSDTEKTAATKASLVNFLRGQTQNEMREINTNKLYRERKAVFGDVIDTQPLYVGKPSSLFADPGYTDWKNASVRQDRAKTVFVGSNDGMLHAVNTTNGDERWAFVPTPAMPNMYWLADTTYTTNHRFFVDGPMTYSDICTASCADAAKAEWRTVLVGGLGAGGRGYYALDVTDSSTPKLLWEFTSKDDADLGYAYGNPVIAKNSKGEWKVLLTSGYNNIRQGNGNPYDADGSGQGILFILDPLLGPGSMRKVSTNSGSTTSPSGLSKIMAWATDPKTDATALYVYGGDLNGDLWRFDINADKTKGETEVIRLAQLVDASGKPQPITARPELGLVNGARMVYVGTGKYLEANDLDSEEFSTQTIYGLVDIDANAAAPYFKSGVSSIRSALVKQTLASAKPVRTVTSNAVSIPTVKGWYVDLPDSGERVNVDLILANGTLLVASNVPTNGICEAGGYSWLNYFDYRTGSYVVGASNVATWLGNDLTTGLNVAWIGGKPEVIRTGSGSAPSVNKNPQFGGGTKGFSGHRVSWRELYQAD